MSAASRTTGAQALGLAVDPKGALRLLAALVARIVALPLRVLVWLYQRLISPALPPACRYYPSCSQYAAEALVLHGAFAGTWLAARRLLRCHPWCEGGFDPVPPRPVPPRASALAGSHRIAHPRH